MGLQPFPGFCGGSYTSRSPSAVQARAVNLCPERIEDPSGKAGIVLYGTPGLAPFAQAAESPGRGMFPHKNRLWSLIGNKFYEVSSAGVLTQRGIVALDLNPGTMDTNDPFGQLALTSGSQVYLFDLNTSAFTNPTAGGTFIVALDQRFVVLDVVLNVLKCSNLNDGATWSPTQSTKRTTTSDPWLAMGLTASKELLILGGKTGDIYYDSGASPFPYVPRSNVLIKPGIKAPFSLKEVNGAMVWLSNADSGAGTVVRMPGYSPVAISNHAVEYAIGQYEKTSRIDDAVGYVYEEDGHFFYVLNFPTAGATWAWDESTGLWHERGTYNGQTGLFGVFGPQYHANQFGMHLVADSLSGSIFGMSMDYFLDSTGAPLRRMRQVPGLYKDGRLVTIDELRLYHERGLGLQAPAQGSDPKVMLQTSLDGGKTWGPERWRSAGKAGDYFPFSQWFTLGSARDWGLRMITSEPIPIRLLTASIDARIGAR